MSQWKPLAGALAAYSFGHGPRVTFLHGFTQTGWSWIPVAERIAAGGREVVIVDLPGHGGSSAVRADLRTSANLVATTAGRSAFVGYSLGGRVALHVALALPHLVVRMALLGATPGIADDDERALRRSDDEKLAIHIEEVGVEAFIDEWVSNPLFAGLQVSANDRANRCTNTVDGLTSSLRLCGTGTQLPLWERLRGLNAPALAMAGEHDAKFSAIAERMSTLIPSASYQIVPAAGHAAHLQYPDVFASILARWLGPGKPPG